MKYKKYILIFLISLFIGCNNAYALDCYYASNDGKVLITYNTDKEKFLIEKRGDIDVASVGTKEPLINNNEDKKDKETKITVYAIKKNTCPMYIVYRHSSKLFGSDGIWGFNNSSDANKFERESEERNKMSAWSLNKTTANKYNEYNKKTQSTGTTIPSGTTMPSIDYDNNIKCSAIFGDKNDPESLLYLINEYLQYPKIIIPILVIGFGTMDFAKAVIAAKEDEMKKAQKTFITRCIIGVAFFFMPVIVNIITYIADLVWNGMNPTCGL